MTKAKRWNYVRQEEELADRSPGPNTNLGISTVKGNKVILPKIGETRFDKRDYIRKFHSNASVSSLESSRSRERFSDSSKIYNQGLTERLNLGKHSANLFYNIHLAEDFVTNLRKRPVGNKFGKE